MKILWYRPPSGLHQELVAVVRALFLARVKTGRRRLRFSHNSRETEQLLKEAVEFAVQEYGAEPTGTRGRRPVAVAAKSTNRRPVIQSCGGL